MGKTVKSRTAMSIASFLFVVAFCLVANSSVPKIYESYKQKAAAQQAAAQATQQIKKEVPVEQPVEEPVVEEPVEEAPVEEEVNVYDVPETPVVEEVVKEAPPEEEPEEDFEFEEEEIPEEEEKEEEGFFDKILSFITGLIEKITSIDIFAKFKDFLADILKVFGIEI